MSYFPGGTPGGGGGGGGLAENVIVPLVPSTTYPYVPTETIIYVRSGGDDDTGDGKTVDTAYATIPRALQDIPAFVFPGVCYTIDCSGMGVVALSGDVYLPQIHGEGLAYNDYAAPTWRSYLAAVNIRAEPTVLDTITSGDVVSDTGDPVSTIRTIVTTKSWTPGEFEGAMLVGPAGTIEIAAISGNTATDLEVCNGYTLSLPAQIVRPSTEFQAASYSPFWVQSMPASFSMSFLKLTTSFSYGAGLVLHSCGHVDLTGCELAALTAYQNKEVISQGCFLVDDGVGADTDWFKNGQMYLRGCYGKNLTFERKTGNARQGHVHTRESVYRGCEPLGQIDYDDGIRGGGFFGYRSEIRDGVSHGVWIGSGTMNKVFQVVIDDCNGDAIQFDGSGGHEIRKVVGTGNGGHGVAIANGAHLIHADANTTVQGTLGDYKVGGNAAAAGGGSGWSAFFGGDHDENDLAASFPQLCRMAQ